MVGASRSDWQLNLRLRLRVYCNLLGVADVQCTRGSPNSETKLKLGGFAPAAPKKKIKVPPSKKTRVPLATSYIDDALLYFRPSHMYLQSHGKTLPLISP